VAVRVIRPQLAEDAGLRARFARDVAAARKVGGPFTAQVVDADLDGPEPWLVAAYVPGVSLAEAVEREGPLPPATVLALAAGLAEGLNAIHAAAIIHGDLKPSDVLLAPDGPRIIGFGISSAVRATSLTGIGLMIGSPGFMSPEQAEGMTIGPSSDVFSLASVLAFAARGEGPFGTGDTAALLSRVVRGRPDLDQIPEGIRPLISRCLSADPAARPTAAEFLADLAKVCPSAANLTDWLPARVRELSAQRAAEAEGHPPAASRAAPASGAGPGLAVAAAASAAAIGEFAADGEPAISGTTLTEPTRTAMPPAPPTGRPAQQAVMPEIAPALPSWAQPPHSGQPGPQGSQWSAPPFPRRRRPRWLWAAVAAACGVVIAALLVGLGGSGHPAAQPRHAPSPRPSPARPTATPAPSVGNLQLAQLQTGDCLTGANMELNSSNPWPKLTSAVPCDQPHTAEVFFADNNFWPKNTSYPGSSAIAKSGNAACNSAFRSYVGIEFSKSIYTWTNIIPDASTWPSGDRGLHCIAYDATPGQPSGATIAGSIKGSRKLLIVTPAVGQGYKSENIRPALVRAAAVDN
jgi:hypothetical protein